MAQHWEQPGAVQTGYGFAITRWSSGIQTTAQMFGRFTYQSAVAILVMRGQQKIPQPRHLERLGYRAGRCPAHVEE